MGRSYQGIFRKTFLVDKSGKIARIFDTVKPEGHAEEVLAVIDQLSKKGDAKKVTAKVAKAAPKVTKAAPKRAATKVAKAKPVKKAAAKKVAKKAPVKRAVKAKRPAAKKK